MADITSIVEATKEIASIAKDALKPEQLTTSDALKEASLEKTIDSKDQAQSDGSFKSLRDQPSNKEQFTSDNFLFENMSDNKTEGISNSRDILTPDAINEDSNYSDKISDYIRSDEENDFYKELGLKENEVNENKCLQRSDIDPNLKDIHDMTNKDRMSIGRPPLGNDGKSINLHHIGQKQDSPLAELTYTEHTQNTSLLHVYGNEGVPHSNTWAKEKSEYWKERSKDF